ncbi:stage II sporulation protein P [Oceanobacillus arenosus]|uniref:stage II sporulation protein P n=1 Tax=Oceanobacillus arenosus TaxID=1229153 RepID=UPI001FE75827|nr:stage II sporulation protein P [Oceanobacillus arenosus]
MAETNELDIEQIYELHYLDVYKFLIYFLGNRTESEIFHEILKNKYPGVSSGIRMTEGPDRGIYNQDLFPNTLLIQIGGVDNTLEEEYKGAKDTL